MGLAEIFGEEVGFCGVVFLETVGVEEEKTANGFHFQISKTEVVGGVLDSKQAFKIRTVAGLGLLQELAVGGIGNTFFK